MKIALKPGHAAVQLTPGVWADPARMVQAVSAAGLQPRPDDIRVTVVGRVHAAGDLLLFTLCRMKATTVLVLRAGEGAEKEALMAELRKRAPAMGTPVEVEGLWQPWNVPAPTAPAPHSPTNAALPAGATNEARTRLHPSRVARGPAPRCAPPPPQAPPLRRGGVFQPVGILAVTRFAEVRRSGGLDPLRGYPVRRSGRQGQARL